MSFFKIKEIVLIICYFYCTFKKMIFIPKKSVPYNIHKKSREQEVKFIFLKKKLEHVKIEKEKIKYSKIPSNLPKL